MNTKRVGLACLVVFILCFGFDFVLHGILLKNAYAQTAQLWRSEAEMKNLFGWLLLGQLLLSVMFCVIYAFRRSTTSCAGQGSAYGFFVGLILASITLITYAVQPIPPNIIGAWIIGDLLKLIIAGAILGAIYQPLSTSATPAAAPVAA